MEKFEIRANNIATALNNSFRHISEFGYSDDPAEESVSRIYGMFVTWLTACEEARLGDGFSKCVIEKLPSSDDASWPIFIKPKPASSLRDRAAALWGVRIAFTHCDGDISQIVSTTNRGYAQDSVMHLPGISLNGSRLVIDQGVVHYAIRTVVQLHHVLP